MVVRRRYGIREEWKNGAWATWSLMFFAISVGGWCFEKLARYAVYHSVGDRGFLSLPLCPIYGFSLFLVYLSAGTPGSPRFAVFPRRQTTWHWRFLLLENRILYFLWVCLIPTLTELVTGAFFRYVLGISLWDYSAQHWNLWGLVCLPYSVLWGSLIFAFMAICWEPLTRACLRLPHRKARCVAILLWVTVALDTAFNVAYRLVSGTHFSVL